jgi:hypothetical protein
MALFVLTLINPSTALEKQHQEAQLVHRALDLARQDFRSSGGKRTSGNINGDGGVLLGSWVYTPAATS